MAPAALASPQYQPSAWSSSKIEIAQTAGLIPDDFDARKFTDRITRKDFCALLINSCRIFKYALPGVPESHPFSDEQGASVEQAYLLGLTQGTADGVFGPDLPLTREMAAVMFGKLRLLFQADAPLMDEQQAAQILEDYAQDSKQLSGWARRYMADAYSRGIIAGTGDGTLNPKDYLTREQAVVLLLNLLAYCDASRLRAAGVTECVLPAPSGMHISPFYTKGQVNLSWNEIPSASAYDIKISKNGALAYTARITDHSLDLRTSTTGSADAVFGSDRQTVYAVLEVVPVNKDGDPSVFSLRREFVVLPAAREREMTSSDRSDPRVSGAAEGRVRLASVDVPVWQLSSTGAKKPATITLTVHQDVVEDVKKIFQEIYEGKEKFPIKSCSGYSDRGGTSQHNSGLAIDINPDENYFVARDGTIQAGKLWKPGENPYSIPPGGDVVKAFNKYGWHWSPDMHWSNGADYMHFSLNGT
ncbi:S-layer homology domain-containing protein [Candidatus Formimonas warabiya]|nr:S-layer homology domain-containing protein [Candidatus Formimonas warabiya]